MHSVKYLKQKLRVNETLMPAFQRYVSVYPYSIPFSVIRVRAAVP